MNTTTQSADTCTTEAAQIKAIAIASTEIRQANGGHEFVTLPPGYSAQSIEHMRAFPSRAKGTTRVNDASSFITVVNDQTTARLRIYGQLYDQNGKADPKFTAVLNDHLSTSLTEPLPAWAHAGWQDHRVSYACPLSTEWKTWTGMHKRSMKQADFAQFIEDNLPDIVTPAAAEMLEIARTLEARKGVNFKSGIRLQNGDQQFTFEETTEAKAGEKGHLSVPERFEIAIPVFEGAKTRNLIVARLRYRIDNGKLDMWYDLERHHKDLEAAMKDLWQEIATGCGTTVINGAPA